MAVVQHPETSYAEDLKFTKAVIDLQSGPVILVGHSYGGAVITEAGNHPKVAALVYIAAFGLDAGESCATIEQGLPPATKGIKATDDGYFYIDSAVFHADFAADLPKAQAAFMAESQVLISADSFTTAVKTPAWKLEPAWYMVATEDRSINPDQERMMAKRMNAKTIEVKSSPCGLHVSSKGNCQAHRRGCDFYPRQPVVIAEDNAKERCCDSISKRPSPIA